MRILKLKSGDKICVIAPSRTMALISNSVKNIAIENFQKLGLEVVFSKNVYEKDEYLSSSISSRLDDLHTAFSDKSVKGIFTVIGGYNSNQLLSKIDYKLIKNNPKILCGFSDITALSNAIFKKTGLITYSGPHFSSLGMIKGVEYTLEYLKKCCFSSYPYELTPVDKWSDDEWYMDQENRIFYDNEGYKVINEGSAIGTLLGGNLCTFNLLQGTQYFPNIKDSILLMEEDNLLGNTSLVEFDRNIQSVIDCKSFSKVKGILIGRFQIGSKISVEQLEKVIKAKKELSEIPIIANIDFGHTTPIVTLPIGGTVKFIAKNGNIQIQIVKH